MEEEREDGDKAISDVSPASFSSSSSLSASLFREDLANRLDTKFPAFQEEVKTCKSYVVPLVTVFMAPGVSKKGCEGRRGRRAGRTKRQFPTSALFHCISLSVEREKNWQIAKIHQYNVAGLLDPGGPATEPARSACA